MLPRVILISWATASAMPLSAQETLTVFEAFNHLNSPGAIFPNGRSEDDIRAMKVLREHPQEAKKLILENLSKGGKRGRPDSYFLIMFVPKGEGLEAMRQIVATYEVGDPETPFLSGLAQRGEERDMKRLMQEIAFAPNSEVSVGLAKIMVEGNNPHAHAALGALRGRIPGSWQESRELIAFFSKSSEVNLPQASISKQLESSQVQRSHSETALNVDSHDLPTPPRSSRVFWIGGGIIVLFLLFFVLKAAR